MKKSIILLGVFSLLISCTADITGLNVITKEPTKVPSTYLFSNAEKVMVDQMVSTNVNYNVFRLFTQQWTETTYTDESNYDVATRTIPDNHWSVLYRDVLKDLVVAKQLLQTEPAAGADELGAKANKEAIIDILIAYNYSILVDTFGNVPYTQALDIQAFPTPSYDDAETIYKDLIAKLTVASNNLDVSFASFDDADLIYGGDAASWKKFANSLRLKLAINMDDVDHAYASTEVLAAVTEGVFTSSGDNAALHYLSAQPNTNPIYVDVIASGRNDFVPADTFVDAMNALNDPRRDAYFTQKDGAFVGGINGNNNTFGNFSHIGPTLLDPTFEGIIMDYTEIEFLLAEAVERGIAIIGGTAEDHYNAGITASFTYWNAPGVASYLTDPLVAYATAGATWKEKIGKQAWLALYNRGFESWTSYRRLDFPILNAPSQSDLSEVPKRFTYPANEETLNGTNSSAASAAIGGNTLTTKLFWDKF